MSDLHSLTISSAKKGLESGELSSVELTQRYLSAISSQNPLLNAYLEVWSDQALEEAKRSDDRRAIGQVMGDLDGIPLAIKDNILVQGRKATSASKVLEGYVSTYDAEVISKLKNQGAVFLGRTNMDEFAMGGSTENSAYGITKNPRDPSCVPGGSSGGSAAAVAADLCLGALGSDTGGSIRQPASFCGITGLKPTYGRVSRSGLMAMASSFDQIGPLTKNAEDAAIIFGAISGHDKKDQTTANVEAFRPLWREDLKGLRVGLPKQAWGDGIDDEVRKSVESTIDVLKRLGAEIIDVDLPYANEALAVYYVVMPCEVSTNLSRFDGMRYGVREPGRDLLNTYLDTRGEHIGREARRRILLGTYALSAGYFDAYYKKAKRVQTLIRNAYASALTHVDVLLTPTTPTVAFGIGEKTEDPLAMYLGDLFTVGANVSGLPAVSFPCADVTRLPVGVHITGRAFDEATLLAIAKVYESATSHG